MDAATRAASISAVIALVLAAAWFFWPAHLGGGTTYVTTHGGSMEPGFSTGDLAVLRAAGSYSVGDVVAYRSESLDTVVMHRIVSGDDAGFVTQGDNNDWLDEDRPADDEILGSLLARIPQGGKVLDALRSPGVLAGVAVAVLSGLGAARRPRARHKLRSGRPSPTFSMSARSRARQVAVGSAAVVLLAAAGCCVLLALPTTQTQTRTIEVVQQGEFSYTGRAEPGTTYPSGAIATGDTVWTRLVSGLTVSFTSTVTGPDPADVAGHVRLDVVLTAPDGWSAVLGSGPVAPLENGTATASVPVDPAAAADLLSRHYEEVGAQGAVATLTVTPVADVTGTVEGRRFSAGSPAGLAFTLDSTSLRPPADPVKTLAPRAQTSVQIDEAVPRSFPVLGVSVPMDDARALAGSTLLAALVTFGASVWISRTGRGDVADQFLVRHADRILPVATFTPGPAVVDVSDAASLHRVAERFDTVVLHHTGPDGDTFAVRDLDMTYRLVVPGPPGRRRGKPAVPAPASAPTDIGAALPVGVPESLALGTQEPPDPTTPLPLIAAEQPDLRSPMPLVAPLSMTAGPWGQVA
jgi:signal peptidase I